VVRVARGLPLLLMLLPAGGCCAPAAALELIAAARTGLAIERQAQVEQHAQVIRQLEAQQAALDSAFDTDVNLAAAGQITDASGSTVTMSPEWIISARKGYIAARDALGRQILAAEAAQRVRLDNLAACDETLELASQLLIRQSAIGRGVKEHLMRIHGRLTHDRRADQADQ